MPEHSAPRHDFSSSVRSAASSYQFGPQGANPALVVTVNGSPKNDEHSLRHFYHIGRIRCQPGRGSSSARGVENAPQVPCQSGTSASYSYCWVNASHWLTVGSVTSVLRDLP